jgi:ATP-dependent RNA/DNA helicase IGHMBP2
VQLPPTVMSARAAAEGLSVTLVDRVAKRFGTCPDVVSMLTVQYRMHSTIMQWSSHELYHDRCVVVQQLHGDALLPSLLL